MIDGDCPDLLIVNARLVDGKGAPPRAPRAIRVRDGVITEIADTLQLDSARCLRAVKRLADAGVPIVAGTDSGGAPVFPNSFHGPTTLAELEIVADLGFTPSEVIQTATRLPAEMLGIADRVGTVEVGKVADLIVLAEDPLADIGAFRTLQWTIAGGHARRPQAWMDA
jgi:imidazolonepropionase-like amidohydrolase